MSYRRTKVRPFESQRGVTLVELMIAVTLVAVISGGMLFAMRTGLMTYEKITQRLRINRLSINTAQILNHQLGSLIPAMGDCPGGAPIPLFIGTPETLRVVSSFSMTEGARGLPQLLEYQVLPSPNGGLRLFVNERPYTGPSSAAEICQGGQMLPVQLTPASFVLADGLAFCHFSYHQINTPNAIVDTGWLPLWNLPQLPPVVRLEMGRSEFARPGLTTAPLPFFSVTVPIRIDRRIGVSYAGL